MKRILSFLTLFVSLVVSSFVSAETTVIENMTYITSKFPIIQDHAVSGVLKKYSNGRGSYYARDKVIEAKKLMIATTVDCMKYSYMQDNKNRKQNAGQIKLIADILRDDKAGLFFQSRDLRGMAFKSFLRSKYRGLNEEEMSEKFYEEYNLKIGSNFTKVISNETMKSEYCKKNGEVLKEKLTEISNR